MKKMLFIGAMLIVGITAFGGRVVDLGPSTPPNELSGDASLGIMTKGEVVDESQNVLLIVKPTLSAGDDETSIHFRFGDMKLDASKEVEGEFIVQVLNKGEAVTLDDDKLTVTLKNDAGQDIGNGQTAVTLYKTNSSDELGSIRYTLTSKKENSNKLYTGKIVSNIDLNGNKTGSFSNSSCYVDISVQNINAQ